MNYQRLHDDVIGVVARQLHYYENYNKISSLKTSVEVIESLDGGVERFRNDHFFRARVQSLTFALMQVIREHVKQAAQNEKGSVKEPNP